MKILMERVYYGTAFNAVTQKEMSVSMKKI